MNIPLVVNLRKGRKKKLDCYIWAQLPESGHPMLCFPWMIAVAFSELFPFFFCCVWSTENYVLGDTLVPLPKDVTSLHIHTQVY